MASEVVSSREYGLGKTHRQDNWWAGPAATAVGLGLFGIYATWRALMNNHFQVGIGTDLLAEEHAHLLSPFYSPMLGGDWLPSWLSPAFLILWAPGGFRLTCYYYRKAYYRAFLLDPPGCAVGEPRKAYGGETRLFLFQNLHRYFLYFALIFLVLLALDVVFACRWPVEGGGREFGVSVGTLVLALSTTLLGLYTFSCHSLRHLVGGNVNCFSCVALGQTRYKLWNKVSLLNKNHMLWAWCSLFGVGFADFYVYMVASERITDLRLF
ncbi:MAG: succinate dehydrogenase [Planctomycetota bacterium]|nr:succinate dehydrogenase [Planctomycetota bacterium]